MPFAQDILTRIVNVNWGGLAVEFTEQPSYLTLDTSLSSMNKVVISFWFRVPKQSADAARAEPFFDFPVFNGVIPLITWGQQQNSTVTDVERYDSGAVDASGHIIMLERISGFHTAPLQPSCIGVYAGDESDPSLHVHIQTGAHAFGTGLLYMVTGFTGEPAGINQNPPTEGYPIFDNIKYINQDISQAVTDHQEYLGNIGSGAGYPEVRVDEWNHLLISWDLIGGSGNRMWCSINDENKNGDDLPAMRDGGPNEHSSSTPFYFGGAGRSVSVPAFNSTTVPSDPMQTPGPPSASRSKDAAGGTSPIAPIATVELAELQIFTGVTLDTSIEANRRAFVDQDGNPVASAEAEALLGRRPDILLHGSSNWINGKNTGDLGIDSDGRPILAGQFEPMGDITSFKPDPSLFGPQSPGSLGHVRLTKKPAANARL